MKDMELTEEEKKERAKKAAAVAIAAALAAGGAAAAADATDYSNIQLPDPVVQDIDAFDDETKQVQQKNVRETIGNILLLPFYAIGAVISRLFDLFVAVAVGPIGSMLLGWVLFAGIILGSLASALKIAFPDIPLKELLTKKRIFALLGGTAAISGACEVIPLIQPDAGIWIFIFKIAGGLVLLIPMFILIRRRIIKRKSQASPAFSNVQYPTAISQDE